MVFVLQERNQTWFLSESHSTLTEYRVPGFSQSPTLSSAKEDPGQASGPFSLGGCVCSLRPVSCSRTLGNTEQHHHHRQRRGLPCEEKPASQRVCFLKPSPRCFHLWETHGTSPWSADPRCYLGVLFSGPQDSFSCWADLSFSCPLWKNLGTSMTAHLLTAGLG